MTLGQKQEAFAERFGKLLAFAYRKGWGVRIGEVLRTKEQAEIYARQGKGIINSVHRLKLAADIFISHDGEVQWGREAYEPLGVYWESLSTPDAECCWGGRFQSIRDPYHFSISHRGVK